MSPAQLQQLLRDALSHHQAGRLDQAEALYRRVRVAVPKNFDAVHLLGVVALQRGRTTEAIDLLTKALQINPHAHVAAMRLGIALTTAGRPADAELHLRRALQADPKYVEALDALAHSLKVQDKLKEAIECHEKSLALNPKSPTSWYNYGLTLSLAGRIADALACHDKALTVDPNYARAHYGRAQSLQQAHRLTEAVAAYDRFLALEPTNHEARSYRLFALNYLDGMSREQLFAEHVDFGRRVGEFPLPDFPQAREPGRKLRIGILSPDLRSHSCAFFLEPLLQHLDREQFEVCLYHDHFRQDAVSARLKQLATVWRNLVGQPIPAIEKIIRADQPDILIDLSGHTGLANRLPVFARHVAPVQVSYLGYPNTTGVPAIGYRLTDATVDPAGEADAFATEKLIRFSETAWAYQPPSDAPEVNSLPAAAPDAPITFGCYNNLAKITEPMLQLWGRLLARVPNSRLVLKGRGLGTAAVKERYHARLAACGIPAERVELLERTAETNSHLALYHRVDIALDTFPYHGTTTTCEALWMGAPVVTLMGDRHVSRVSGSLLKAVGHPEWIANTTDDYVRICAELASDRTRLASIRSGLREELRRSQLLNHAGQAMNFGKALRACWTEWCQRRPADQAPVGPAITTAS